MWPLLFCQQKENTMNLDAMLAQLQKDYVTELPDKISQMESHYTTGDFEALRDDFHKIKGTGKTYGLPEVSLLGEATENLCIHKPQALPEAIPLAIAILKDIHQKRSQGHEMPIATDPRYQKLTRL